MCSPQATFEAVVSLAGFIGTSNGTNAPTNTSILRVSGSGVNHRVMFQAYSAGRGRWWLDIFLDKSIATVGAPSLHQHKILQETRSRRYGATGTVQKERFANSGKCCGGIAPIISETVCLWQREFLADCRGSDIPLSSIRVYSDIGCANPNRLGA